jgi:heme oxygenase
MTDMTRRWLLRERTAEAHAGVDAAVGGFDDLMSYRAYLLALAAFRAPLEKQIAAETWPLALVGWQPKCVGSAIAADLADLGLVAPAGGCGTLALEGDRLFGALYVLEGSALGARILLKRAQALGLGASYGARHLALLADDIDGWRGFLDRLERAEPFDMDGAVAGSMAAFALAQDAFRVPR